MPCFNIWSCAGVCRHIVERVRVIARQLRDLAVPRVQKNRGAALADLCASKLNRSSKSAWVIVGLFRSTITTAVHLLDRFTFECVLQFDWSLETEGQGSDADFLISGSKSNINFSCSAVETFQLKQLLVFHLQLQVCDPLSRAASVTLSNLLACLVCSDL